MQVQDLKKVLDILDKYQPSTGCLWISAEHDELFIDYDGTLSEQDWNALQEVGAPHNLKENYQDYLDNAEYNDTYIAFYV